MDVSWNTHFACNELGSSSNWNNHPTVDVSGARLSCILPKNYNIAPENRPGPKRKLIFQPSIFRCYVSFREGTLWKTNMENTNHPWKERKIIFQTPMIMFHVNLQGGYIIGFFFFPLNRIHFSHFSGGQSLYSSRHSSTACRGGSLAVAARIFYPPKLAEAFVLLPRNSLRCGSFHFFCWWFSSNMREIFPWVSNFTYNFDVFVDFPIIFHDFPIIFHDFPILFHDFPIIFHDVFMIHDLHTLQTNFLQLEAAVGSLKLPTLDYHTWYWLPATWQHLKFPPKNTPDISSVVATQIFFIFQFDEHIFFKWVETN